MRIGLGLRSSFAVSSGWFARTGNGDLKQSKRALRGRCEIQEHC